MKPHLTFESPYGCRWCGDERHHHGSQWAPIIGMHRWLEPSQAMVLERMTRRHNARLNAEPPKYHATTAWAADHTGESADPYCADCKTDSCPRWLRIQDRRARSRWDAIPKLVQAGSSGWGGDVPF